MSKLSKLLFEEPKLVPEKVRQLSKNDLALQFYTTSVEETPSGKTHIVQWTDSSRFQFYDPRLLRFALPLLAVILLIAGAANPNSGTAPIGGIVLLGSAGFWLYSYLYERLHTDQRGIAFAADGTLTVLNPPPQQTDRYAVMPGFEIANGLSRITSIEYSKTQDWVPIDSKRVFGSNHWYDIHMFIGNEWRISICRNYGSRDHVHQITAQLNRLRAELAQAHMQALAASQTTVA